jgi:hypothetical protein
MSSQYSIGEEGLQASPVVAQFLSHQLTTFVHPLLIWLDARLDLRLVHTFLATLHVLLEFRHRNNGLLLSELGAYLASPDHAPAGTKRLSNLVRSSKWTPQLIERFLWQQADQRLAALEQAGEAGLLLWDESVIEKPESIAMEGLCAVQSSKARRLKRIKPGYYNPPGGPPIFVPGLHWLAVLLLGRQGPPTLAAMRWWTTRGSLAQAGRDLETGLLDACVATWERRLLHIFDRGFAGRPWIGLCLERSVRFLMRWLKDYKLRDAQGNNRKAWQITRGKRAWAPRQVWDGRRQHWFQAGVVAVPVRHPEYEQALWLVVSRPGKGQPPWYLLTTESILTEQDAWSIVFAYARRWQIEMTWRYNKSELAGESPRLWSWENRLKLLLMVSLVYAFLLTLLDERTEALRLWLLRYWCHRTGKRCRETTTPLYRLRWAISRLWLTYAPSLLRPRLLNSG